jgi:hypothetical protein
MGECIVYVNEQFHAKFGQGVDTIMSQNPFKLSDTTFTVIKLYHTFVRTKKYLWQKIKFHCTEC